MTFLITGNPVAENQREGELLLLPMAIFTTVIFVLSLFLSLLRKVKI